MQIKNAQFKPEHEILVFIASTSIQCAHEHLHMLIRCSHKQREDEKNMCTYILRLTFSLCDTYIYQYNHGLVHLANLKFDLDLCVYNQTIL